MLVLGFNGGFEPVAKELYPGVLVPGADWAHDSSAVLLRDNQIVAAIESERLDRIKHSPKVPFRAAFECLRMAGVSPGELDALAWNGVERMHGPPHRASHFLSWVFGRVFFRDPPPPDRCRVIDHHLAHAASAWGFSGFDEQLTLTLDWIGDGVSGIAGVARGSHFEKLHTYAFPHESLGVFYGYAINALGYGSGEEYKVMGLAPYGDPERYRGVFESTFKLLPDGGYFVDDEAVRTIGSRLPSRKPGESFTQDHMDVAAAIQASYERMAMHTIEYWARRTGQKQLSLAGGCAQNSSFNGSLLRSGLFENVFVQPAAYDSGCALGAALIASIERGEAAKPPRLRDVRFGRALPSGRALEETLARWHRLVTVMPSEDIAAIAARRLAAGQVLGWAEGRSEFGARALGGRSILADPRPAGNKDRINAMIKMREAYRPFAPSVQAEHVHEYFESGPDDVYPFMTFVVPVRPRYRELLGAVTHVDGTARIQTVDRETSRAYWALIEAFRRETGLPIVLNTSFNNNREPIVDTVEDALECFLTTGLDALVVGHCMVERRGSVAAELPTLTVQLPEHVHVDGARLWSSGWRLWTGHHQREISSELSAVLAHAHQTPVQLASLFEIHRCPGELTAEILSLWSERWIRVQPAHPRG